MSIDRSWMYMSVGEKRKRQGEYIDGIKAFITFALEHPECVDNGRIRCPCRKCENGLFKRPDDVITCLKKNGFKPNYRIWTKHGEIDDSDMGSSHVVDRNEGNGNWARDMVMEAAGHRMQIDDDGIEPELPNNDCRTFYNLFEAADEPLWEGCETHTKLSATTLLLHIKSEYGVSNACFDNLLKAIVEMLPKESKLPESFYRCKALMKDLGLPCEMIHACENDCILFHKEYANLNVCPVCEEPRYKRQVNEIDGEKKTKLIPKKVLRYLPLIPRLKRLYLSSKTAKHMRWHKMERKDKPDEMRHPADSEEWKRFDRNFSSFASDARNVRLGLSTDGFNPFGQSSQSYSIWPVFVVPYNLPPWMCMKEEFMFMSLLIPGPFSPGREIDVYLQPLIDELKTLWVDGVETYDSYVKQNFNMRAMLLWTISDFPALGMLKGWSTHGLLGCPSCQDKDVTFYLKHGRKPCYFGCHRRWLDMDDLKWRVEEKNKFNKKAEMRGPPCRRSGSDELEYVSQFESIILGKGRGSHDKVSGFGVEHNFTKKSIFFQLPYWSFLLIRHNLDVMHIEKNFFDNVFNIVMDTKGKTKDNLSARMDLKELGIKRSLHPREMDDGKIVLPKANYTLTSEQVKEVCKWLKCLKVPDGYASNISRCVDVENRKVSGLKSHDCHVLMQRFMPIAFRDFLEPSIWEPLNAISQFFKDICSKVYKVEELDNLENFIANTLCKLETIFPPSFFDSMEHLPIHVAYEAKFEIAEARSKIQELVKTRLQAGRLKWSDWEPIEVEYLWKEYLRYFRYDETIEGEEARMQRVWNAFIEKNYRIWMCRWKTTALDKWGSIEVAKTHTPSWTTSVVWNFLCDHWLSDKHKQSSELHKAQRASGSSFPHTAGNTPFVIVEHRREMEVGRELTQYEKYELTHATKSKDGNELKWVSESSKKTIEDYGANLLAAYPDSDCPINELDDPNLSIYKKTVGVKKGRSRGRPGERWSARSNGSCSTQVAQEESAKEIKRLKEKVSQQNSDIEMLKETVATLNTVVSRLQDQGMTSTPSPTPTPIQHSNMRSTSSHAMTPDDAYLS